ncbi:MAG: hypothetical protein JSR09_01735 [Bacteroidetes bacterium]|nr:hypothetical protein [Bacteroidota bacterium]MBS1648402.1 hypothetical protein [Bacteroidota bacterium]
MSEHNYEEGGVIKNYTLTSFLAFAVIFCLLVLFATCHGPYKKVGDAGKDRLAMQQPLPNNFN